MKSGNADVYKHEIPGGQYTNLQFQVIIGFQAVTRFKEFEIDTNIISQVGAKF